jgi:hypothetical protein
MIRRRWRLCTVSLLKMSLLENLKLGDVLVVVHVAVTRIGSLQRNLFSLFFFVGLCASVISLGYFVIPESECNWYLCDINIFSL